MSRLEDLLAAQDTNDGDLIEAAQAAIKLMEKDYDRASSILDSAAILSDADHMRKERLWRRITHLLRKVDTKEWDNEVDDEYGKPESAEDLRGEPEYGASPNARRHIRRSGGASKL